MPRLNRVQPDGHIIAVADRGLYWGNRGSLHDKDGRLVRYSRGNRWIICVLQFKGRHRTLTAPGRLTELFFLDEATALAAGHRPCGECRLTAYRAFTSAWAVAHRGEPANAPRIDARLHIDRLAGPATKRTYQERLTALPDGAMIELDGHPWLVHGDELLAWSPGGYRQRQVRTQTDVVTVLTPRATVDVLRSGYRPELHPTASVQG